jgi:hypothetical protein
VLRLRDRAGLPVVSVPLSGASSATGLWAAFSHQGELAVPALRHCPTLRQLLCRSLAPILQTSQQRRLGGGAGVDARRQREPEPHVACAQQRHAAQVLVHEELQQEGQMRLVRLQRALRHHLALLEQGRCAPHKRGVVQDDLQKGVRVLWRARADGGVAAGARVAEAEEGNAAHQLEVANEGAAPIWGWRICSRSLLLPHHAGSRAALRRASSVVSTINGAHGGLQTAIQLLADLPQKAGMIK